MDVMTAIKGRRSIRSFKPDLIEPDKIDALKDALVWAPSAGNLQSRRFYFVSNPGVKKELAEAASGQTFILEAPLVVVGCADLELSRRYGARGTDLYCIQDVSAGTQNLLLAAYELGLGSLWVGSFSEDQVSAVLKLLPHLRPVVIVPIGYPAEDPAPPERLSHARAIEDID